MYGYGRLNGIRSEFVERASSILLGGSNTLVALSLAGTGGAHVNESHGIIGCLGR